MKFHKHQELTCDVFQYCDTKNFVVKIPDARLLNEGFRYQKLSFSQKLPL